MPPPLGQLRETLRTRGVSEEIVSRLEAMGVFQFKRLVRDLCVELRGDFPRSEEHTVPVPGPLLAALVKVAKRGGEYAVWTRARVNGDKEFRAITAWIAARNSGDGAWSKNEYRELVDKCFLDGVDKAYERICRLDDGGFFKELGSYSFVPDGPRLDYYQRLAGRLCEIQTLDKTVQQQLETSNDQGMAG